MGRLGLVKVLYYIYTRSLAFMLATFLDEGSIPPTSTHEPIKNEESITRKTVMGVTGFDRKIRT